jgi:hypothetical protein
MDPYPSGSWFRLLAGAYSGAGRPDCLNLTTKTIVRPDWKVQKSKVIVWRFHNKAFLRM